MTLLVTYLVQSTLVLGLAAALDRWVLRDPSLKDTLWKAALVASLAAPALGWTSALVSGPGSSDRAVATIQRREYRLDATPPAALPAPTRLRAEVDLDCWRGRVATLPTAEAVRSAMRECRVGGPLAWGWGAWVFGSILTLSMILAVGHVRDTARLWRLIGRGRMISVLQTPAGRVRLVALEGIAGPFAAGRRTVVLPLRSFGELSNPQMRAVVAHELGHIRRRDPLWQWTARLVEHALFFQPLNRLCRRGLEEAAEWASDDLARQSLGSGRPLAESIATVSSWAVEASPSPALSRRPGMVTDRVARLLSPAPPEEPPMFSLRLGVIALVVLTALLAPTSRPGPAGSVGSVEMIVDVSGAGLGEGQPAYP